MSVRFLVDNNLSPQLARALKVLGESVEHVQDVYGTGDVPDPQILADAGRGGLTLISRDMRNRTVPGEIETIRKYGVGGFWLGGKNLSHCDMVQQVIRNWPEMKRKAAKTPRPFMFVVRPHGKKIEQLSL